MTAARLRILLLVSMMAMLLVVAACGSGDDDDDNDNDVTPDDDTADDDTVFDDDTGDDDATPDDDDATPDDDDDDTAPGPYDGMTPTGTTVDEMLAIASHMSTGAAYSREREFEIEKSVEAGITYSRRGFYWNHIEPENDVWQFDGYDEMVRLLREAGLQPNAMLTRGVDWAMPGGSPSDIDPADFADFTGTVADRYADDIDLYEIWNEQNSTRFWDPEPDPEHYGLLLEAAYAAIHENDPNAIVLFGGMSPFDDVHLFDPRGIWNFLARVGEFHPDLCDFIDGVAIHPYTFLQQPGPELSLDFGIYRYPDLRNTVADVRGMLDELGCADKPIHFTEMGWPSLLIGNDRQAAYFVRGALLARTVNVQGYFWYTFYDEEPGSSPPTEDYFGLYELPDGVTDPDPKPAYHALVGLHEVLGDARYAGDLGLALGWENDCYALVFADDASRWTVALWHAGLQFGQETTVTVPLHSDATGDWTMLDQEGAQLATGNTADGEVEVAADGRVVYLQFEVSP